MADVVDRKTRSRMMAGIRSRDTKPERQVRSMLHRMGYRFTLRNRKLPGSPDIVLPRYRTAIFVHGCFWHRHPGCPKATIPATRAEFWQQKFAANVARDARAVRALDELGWRVITVWECELRHPDTVGQQLQRVIGGGRSLEACA